MPTNLTADQLAALQLLMRQNASAGYGGATTTDYTGTDGNTFHLGMQGGTGSLVDGYSPWQTTSLLQDLIPGRNQTGDMQHVYDPATGGYQTTHAVPRHESGLIPLLMALGGMGATIGGLGAAAGAAGGAGEMGAANGLWDVLPEAVGSGMGGSGTGAMGAAGAASATGAGSGLSTMPYLEPLSISLETVPAAFTGAGSGLLSTLANSGLSSMLGPAATALGGLAGAQGQQSEQSTTRDIPEWLKPFILGSNGQPGLLGHASNLLNEQMAPGARQGYTDMQNIGRGLMSRPVAGNPLPSGFLSQYMGGR